MSRIAVVITILLALSLPTQALADCYRNGKRVADGTRVGPMVCEDSKWVYRP
jgi:hypothetical protein